MFLLSPRGRARWCLQRMAVLAAVLVAWVVASVSPALASGSATVSFGISVVGPASGPGGVTAASYLLSAAAGFFGADASFFIQYSAQPRAAGEYDFGPSVTAFYLARDARVDVATVWSMHHSGASWWAWANKHGLAGKYVKLVPRGKLKKDFYKGKAYYYVLDRDFEQVMTVRFMADYYGIPSSQVWTLVANRGFLGYTDVFAAIGLAGKAGVAPEVIIEQRRRGLAWDEIGARYRLPGGVWWDADDQGWSGKSHKEEKHGHDRGQDDDDKDGND